MKAGIKTFLIYFEEKPAYEMVIDCFLAIRQVARFLCRKMLDCTRLSP